MSLLDLRTMAKNAIEIQNASNPIPVLNLLHRYNQATRSLQLDTLNPIVHLLIDKLGSMVDHRQLSFPDSYKACVEWAERPDEDNPAVPDPDPEVVLVWQAKDHRKKGWGGGVFRTAEGAASLAASWVTRDLLIEEVQQLADWVASLPRETGDYRWQGKYASVHLKAEKLT